MTRDETVLWTVGFGLLPAGLATVTHRMRYRV
jgi:hypothetical protein